MDILWSHVFLPSLFQYNIHNQQSNNNKILLHCIVQYVTQLHVSAPFRPSSGCICLALRVMYPDDKVYYFVDEISSSKLSRYNLTMA